MVPNSQPILLIVSVLLVWCPGHLLGSSSHASGHLRKLFDSLDKDHDGQLQQQELSSYIVSLAPEFTNSNQQLQRAVAGAIGRLDSPDAGLGVSQAELEQHLHTLLQVRVCWSKHHD